jgi:hypothetical protein
MPPDPPPRRAAAWLLALLPVLLACRFAPDTRPLQDRLDEVPQAFVGRVVTLHDGVATFAVEVPLRGAPLRELRVPIGSDSCDIRFQAGERWLYAGPRVPDPSRRLGSASVPLAQAMARRDDGGLGIEAWQRCGDSAECVLVAYGCSLTAAHRDHRQLATERAWSVGANPRTRNCTGAPEADSVAACVGGRCGAWVLRSGP